MANRYQSIVDGIAGTFLLSLCQKSRSPAGRWKIEDGHLALLTDTGELFLFDFEKRGDSLSEVLAIPQQLHLFIRRRAGASNETDHRSRS